MPKLVDKYLQACLKPTKHTATGQEPSASHLYTNNFGFTMNAIQWNNPDSSVTKECAHISEVSLFQVACKNCSLGKKRCPY